MRERAANVPLPPKATGLKGLTGLACSLRLALLELGISQSALSLRLWRRVHLGWCTHNLQIQHCDGSNLTAGKCANHLQVHR